MIGVDESDAIAHRRRMQILQVIGTTGSVYRAVLRALLGSIDGVPEGVSIARRAHGVVVAADFHTARLIQVALEEASKSKTHALWAGDWPGPVEISWL